MNKTEKQFKAITDQLAHWAKKTKVEYPQHLEDSLRSALDKLDVQAFSTASKDVLSTLEGRKRHAKQAGKSIGKSAATLQRTYMKSTQDSVTPKGSGALYGLGATALIIAACLAAMWRATRSNNA
ncbi:hypothetical protein CQ018_11680 [Arthrobacter sp. MYb227]|uniref:hypothetical protein n=1 Tax=Arthrobacter sp. MYb227 TaxID=1848601 RepID=UPI000CFA9592|nr:hypothetical protein [Arthrobacter sp. MYb227]PQZ92177.1 hypothetical protein CQ018_11680 [Arthrobacter sp. MYb227]